MRGKEREGNEKPLQQFWLNGVLLFQTPLGQLCLQSSFHTEKYKYVEVSLVKYVLKLNNLCDKLLNSPPKAKFMKT